MPVAKRSVASSETNARASFAVTCSTLRMVPKLLAVGRVALPTAGSTGHCQTLRLRPLSHGLHVWDVGSALPDIYAETIARSRPLSHRVLL